MNDDPGSTQRRTGDARRELAALDEQTLHARADLAALQQEIADAKQKWVNRVQMEHLIEANQQLVLAMLSAQSEATKPLLAEARDLYPALREANQELVISALKAQNLQAKAEQDFLHQKNVLTMVAHELRNPLMPISMIAERMLRVPSRELPKMQALIQDRIRHMTRLIEDLLDVSRVNTGKLRLERVDIDIVKTLEVAVEACQPLMLSRDLLFSAKLPRSSVWVNADEVRLSQIIHNLLTNAAKYTPSGGKVELIATAISHAVIIRVCDNGIGISNGILAKVFEPYVQDIGAVQFNGSGLGIGLTVVRELVEAHGGTVVGTSAGEGRGSMFTVTLPTL